MRARPAPGTYYVWDDLAYLCCRTADDDDDRSVAWCPEHARGHPLARWVGGRSDPLDTLGVGCFSMVPPSGTLARWVVHRAAAPLVLLDLHSPVHCRWQAWDHRRSTASDVGLHVVARRWDDGQLERLRTTVADHCARGHRVAVEIAVCYDDWERIQQFLQRPWHANATVWARLMTNGLD